MQKITVRSRLGEKEAITDGIVAAFDHYDSEAGRDVRHYILLDESVKLVHEPWGWQNRWYVDLVQITTVDDTTVQLADLYVDIIVEGNGPTYRVIDLEEFIDALASGDIGVEELRDPLHRLQAFLDCHIHAGRDFPPACIRSFMPE
jgi:predicted RNA-binding protein associated with RNAse of E/G family